MTLEGPLYGSVIANSGQTNHFPDAKLVLVLEKPSKYALYCDLLKLPVFVQV